jgi:hypothetical protein
LRNEFTRARNLKEEQKMTERNKTKRKGPWERWRRKDGHSCQARDLKRC